LASGFQCSANRQKQWSSTYFSCNGAQYFRGRQFKPDIGIGQTISITTKGSPFFMMPAEAGCRYQPADKNYYIRLSYTPIISYLIDFQIQHWGGFTYAYSFQKQ
jgi:hypothetical protein